MKNSDKKLFIILSTQRSGSTYLQEWLNGHPDIRCHDEMFLRHRDKPDSFGSFLGTSLFSRHLAAPFRSGQFNGGGVFRIFTRRFLKALLSDNPPAFPTGSHKGTPPSPTVGKLCEASCVGFKLQANQAVEMTELSRVLRVMNVNVIFLRRESLLDVYVSRLVAEKRGVYHSKSRGTAIEPFSIDPQDAVRAIERISEIRSSAEGLFRGCQTYELTYEALVDPSRTEKELSMALAFLGARDLQIPRPPLQKQVNQPVHELIENFQDVRAELMCHGYSETGMALNKVQRDA